MAVVGGLCLAPASWATPVLTEGFDDVSTLSASGWVQVNNSSPGGSTGWFQGNTSVFDSQTGAPDSYIGANFENAGMGAGDTGGTISNWLLTPELSLVNGDTFTFWTQSAGSGFPDRLEVRMSTNGGSTDVGTTDSSVGDFTTLLLTINPGLAVDGYPSDWTAYTLTLSGLADGTTGRLAFHYAVPDSGAGPNADNGDYIGIDTVSYAPVPEPGTLLLVGSGALALLRRRRQVR